MGSALSPSTEAIDKVDIKKISTVTATQGPENQPPGVPGTSLGHRAKRGRGYFRGRRGRGRGRAR